MIHPVFVYEQYDSLSIAEVLFGVSKWNICNLRLNKETQYNDKSSVGAQMQLSYLGSQAPLWAFLLYSVWTRWRLRPILSGLQRVHGNTNETCLSAGQ